MAAVYVDAPLEIDEDEDMLTGQEAGVSEQVIGDLHSGESDQ